MPVRAERKSVLSLAADGGRVDDARRRLLADWCRLVGGRLSGQAQAPLAPPALTPTPAPTPASTPAEAIAALGLPPRMGQILAHLLVGQSEKQIARGLSISPHTVHTYVKQLHKRLDVCSRGELLARFLPDATSLRNATSLRGG